MEKMLEESTNLNAYSYIKQVRVVTFLLTLIVILGGVFAYSIWNQFCGNELLSCFSDPDGVKPVKYLFLSLLRPFTLLPSTVISIMGAESFVEINQPNYLAITMIVLGQVLSFVFVYAVAKIIGKKLVNPWLSNNLPQTLKFVRSQDWKITTATRLFPFIPFDFFSLLYGLLDFRFKQTLITTTIIATIESYILIQTMSTETSATISALSTTGIIFFSFVIPGLILEWLMRKRGSSLTTRLAAMKQEIMSELKLNNDIVKRNINVETKAPILLLYGFFSSRKSLSVLESLLKRRGYEVLSFNLGGMFNIFNTRGIIDTARFIDSKLKRQFERHNFQQVNIVAHSKGGLVAIWWLLKLGGHKHCNRLITMGTPYYGSKFTWLALVTPLGYYWKDVWQMRPGSRLLKIIAKFKIPNTLQIFCFHSNKDKVVTGKKAIYKSDDQDEKNISPVPMNHISHFEYLHKRDVAERIAIIIGKPEPKNT